MVVKKYVAKPGNKHRTINNRHFFSRPPQRSLRLWKAPTPPNIWYRRYAGNMINNNMPLLINNNGRLTKPNMNGTKLKIFAVLPEENWPSNHNRGLSVNVQRKGVGHPWRLVNKQLNTKYRLETYFGNQIGLWGGALFRKSTR
jgi:hypothetical protein